MTATDTDHAAFLATIAADLASDLPRRVYADFLEENARGSEPCPDCHGTGHRPVPGREAKAGQDYGGCSACHGSGRITDGNAERAEFIRVQCELAGYAYNCEEAGFTCETLQGTDYERPLCRPCTLRARERELFAASLGLWGLRGSGGITWAAYTDPAKFAAHKVTDRNPAQLFSRGFVSHITLDLGTLCGERCRRCWGRGFIEELPEEDRIGILVGDTGVSYGWTCPICKGKRTTPGIAAELGRACPTLEAVTVTGIGAEQIGDHWFWFREGNRAGTPLSTLPPVIYDPMHLSDKGRARWKPSECTAMSFDSPASAQNALNAAALRLIRLG